MGSLLGQPPKSPEEGAAILINCAVEDIKGTTGKYFENPSPYDKEKGTAIDWPGQ